MPPKFAELARIEDNLQTDRFALYRSVNEEPEDASEFEWDEEEERHFEERQARFNKEFFGERSVEEILQEMEALKRSGYESEAHKVARFRQLKVELDVILHRPNTDI
jgi:hypothetical protein